MSLQIGLHSTLFFRLLFCNSPLQCIKDLGFFKLVPFLVGLSCVKYRVRANSKKSASWMRKLTRDITYRW